MSVHENLIEISKSLENLEETGIYDVEKYSCSLKHLTNQLEYFYCHLVKENGRDIDSTYYHLSTTSSSISIFQYRTWFP